MSDASDFITPPAAATHAADRRDPQAARPAQRLIGLAGEVDDVTQVGADDEANDDEDRTKDRQREQDR